MHQAPYIMKIENIPRCAEFKFFLSMHHKLSWLGQTGPDLIAPVNILSQRKHNLGGYDGTCTEMTKDFGEPKKGRRPGYLVTIKITTTASEENTSTKEIRSGIHELQDQPDATLKSDL